MDSPADVLVIGDALLDVSAAPSEPMRPGGDVPAAIRVGPGGQGANVAVRLARRGIRVRLACALADDASGRMVRQALEAEGVVLDAAPADVTGAVVILVSADGERSMLSRRVPLLPRAVEAAPWTVVSGYVLLEDAELDLRADDHPAVAVLGSALPGDAAGKWLRRADALSPAVSFLNTDELRSLGGDARSLRGLGLVVVTGPGGATAVHPERNLQQHRAAASRGPAVDTSGAGDAFAAAFLSELHGQRTWSDADIDRALAAGLDLAAQVAGVAGAQTIVPLERQGAPA